MKRKDCTDKVAGYKLAGEDLWRSPRTYLGETFELSAGLGWIQHIIEGEEIKRVNTEYVVEIEWEIKKEGAELESAPPATQSPNQEIIGETSSKEGVIM